MARIEGIIFQSDGRSTIGRVFIRPLETIDRVVAGLSDITRGPSLAMHAGIRVVLEDGRPFVAEQLVGSFYMDFLNGLNWTPLEHFRQRDRGGWDVTVPATSFRRVDDDAVADTVARLNRLDGHAFVGEDCTAFIERAFGNRRLFADSPLLQRLGLGVRIGDPALPLIRPDAEFDAETRQRLRTDDLKDLPDALADPLAPNGRVWLRWLSMAAGTGAGLGVATHLLWSGRKSLRGFS